MTVAPTPIPPPPAVAPTAPVAAVAPTVPNYDYHYGEDLLKVRGLSVSYERPILRDVDFTIRNIIRPGLAQGQIDGLLAPSGMGKTQLFRCIAGIQRPNMGSIHLGDGDASTADWEVTPGQVGVIAQDYPLFAHLTVIDNLVLAALRKIKDRNQALTTSQELLARFGLEEAGGKYPHEISGGMRQRAAIIQGVLACGHLMLMDEPFSGLDPLRREAVQELIQGIAASHELNSIVITTHDIASAIAVCDTITLLGREKDADGNIIPGATVRFRYNLMDMGLTWRPNLQELPQFRELEREILARFHEL